MRLIITIHELDLVPSEQIGIQKDRIVRIEHQLCSVGVQLIVVKQRDDIHQCHRVDGGIELIDDQDSTFTQGLQDKRKQVDESDRSERLEQIYRNGSRLNVPLEYGAKLCFLMLSIQDISQGVRIDSKQGCRIIQRFFYEYRLFLRFGKLADQLHRIRPVDDDEAFVHPLGKKRM